MVHSHRTNREAVERMLRDKDAIELVMVAIAR
jgi:hypothetical protein